MFEKIRDLMVDALDLDAEEIKPESSFEEDLKVDSLDLYELVMSMEDEFGVEIPTEDLTDMKTVGDIVKYMEAHAA